MNPVPHVSLVRLSLLVGILLHTLSVQANENNAQKSVQINKFCSPGKVVTIFPGTSRREECLEVVNGRNWTGFLYDSDTLKPLDATHAASVKLSYSNADLPCKNNDWKSASSVTSLANVCKNSPTEDEPLFIFLTNGKLMWRSDKCTCGKCKNWRPLAVNYYIDGLGCSTNDGKGATYSGLESHQILSYCRSQLMDEQRKALRWDILVTKIFIGVLVITAFFYLLTTLAYGLLWKRQNLPGKTLFSVVLSRTLMYVFWSAAYFGGLYRLDIGCPGVCQSIGILTYFFLISGYSWTLLLNYDFWKTFRSLRPARDSTSVNKTFLKYACFGIGAPFLITGISVLLDYVHGENTDPNFIPNYGKGICFMVECAHGFYIYAIPAFFLVPSFIFALLTFYALYRIRVDTECIKEAKHHHHSAQDSEKSSFRLYIKLFVVMSISWQIELLVWGIQKVESAQGVDYGLTRAKIILLIFQWIDLLGTSIIIFIVFACKKSTMSQLRGMYPRFNSTCGWIRRMREIFPLHASNEAAPLSPSPVTRNSKQS